MLGKDKFIDALLNNNVCLRVHQLRPITLRAALEHVLEFESYQPANVRDIRVGETQTWRQPQQSEC